MSAAWQLRIGEQMHGRLHGHLFPGDEDEHAAVIAAGIVRTDRGTRLLARDLFLARDGIDFVPGRRSYRRLVPEFVNEKIRYCREQKLIYLSAHSHPGRGAVSFSDHDLESHERGYPALLDISGQPVGALVLSEDHLAADIWTADRDRRPVIETVVIGRNLSRVYPQPPPPPASADPMYDRAVRWFGERGQDLLGQTKVAVIGAGGVGQPLIGMLARLGVGSILVIEPERIDPTNLPRMPEARRLDAMMPLRRIPGLDALADRLSTSKVALARRVARRANPKVEFIGIRENVNEPSASHALVDCDFIFLAADSHQARQITNIVAHQYLIPAIQIGTRIEIDPDDGEVGEIRGNVRLILPERGCLQCNHLISAEKLQEESLPTAERERNRYVEEIPAPSVINFNVHGASQAVTDFTLMLGGFIESEAPLGYLRWHPRRRREEPVGTFANAPECPHCGSLPQSRRGRGDGMPLPGPER
ncbi:MAG: ThiF family adenylyltransferase [Thermoleophilia bacterium]|nr:ThiF family adenylyltransferase [Thermoleophilia bacterium]